MLRLRFQALSQNITVRQRGSVLHIRGPSSSTPLPPRVRAGRGGCWMVPGHHAAPGAQHPLGTRTADTRRCWRGWGLSSAAPMSWFCERRCCRSQAEPGVLGQDATNPSRVLEGTYCAASPLPCELLAPTAWGSGRMIQV